MRARPKRWMTSMIATAKTTQVALPYARAVRAPRAADARPEKETPRSAA